MLGLIGTKLGMTNLFHEDGSIFGVTVLSVEPNAVHQVKTTNVDGYSALQLGAGKKNLNRPEAGHRKSSPSKFLSEFRVDDVSVNEVGSFVDLSLFDDVSYVDVQSVSLGKGFQGTVKRHNFSRGPETHGHDNHRAPGSIGACALPGKVLKGKRMAGRMGRRKVTVLSLKVARLDKDKNLLYVLGSVPGKKGTVVRIKRAVKKGDK